MASDHLIDHLIGEGVISLIDHPDRRRPVQGSAPLGAAHGIASKLEVIGGGGWGA